MILRNLRVRILLFVMCVMLSACGGGGTGNSDSTPMQEVTPAELGLASVLVDGLEERTLYVPSQGNLSAKVMPVPAAATTLATTLSMAMESGGNAISISQGKAQWEMSGSFAGVPSASDIPANLVITDSALHKFTKVALTVKFLAPSYSASAPIGAAGGTVAMSTGKVLTFQSNTLTNPVDVTVSEFAMPTGGTTVRIDFSADVSGAGLKLVLPDPENTPATTLNSSSQTPRRHILAASSGLATACVAPSTVVPYAHDKNLGHHWWSNSQGNVQQFGRLAWYTSKGLVWTGAHRIPTNSVINVDTYVALASSTITPSGRTIEVVHAEGSQLHSVLPRTETGIDLCGAEPVLFVHGFKPAPTPGTLGGGIDTWKNFPALATDAVNLGSKKLVPFEFRWNTDARFVDVAGDLVKEINRIHILTGSKIHIVAHSFGGVLVRTVLQELAQGVDIQSQTDAINAVASLLTLGTPHSGIADDPIKFGEIVLPSGQDSKSFDGCDQISCYVMGEDIFLAQTDQKYGLIELLGLVAPGQHAARLAQTVDKLPAIPIVVGIGLSAEAQLASAHPKFKVGDYLISYRGQRFHPTYLGPKLQRGTTVGQAKLYEVILGTRREVQPDDELNDAEKQQLRSRGYLHSDSTGAANAMIWGALDGDYQGFGIEAAPIAGCATGKTCQHDGYLLFRILMSGHLCEISEQGCPKVTEMICKDAYVGQLVSCTATGQSLIDGLVLEVNGCTDYKEVAGGTAVSRTYTCTRTTPTSFPIATLHEPNQSESLTSNVSWQSPNPPSDTAPVSVFEGLIDPLPLNSAVIGSVRISDADGDQIKNLRVHVGRTLDGSDCQIDIGIYDQLQDTGLKSFNGCAALTGTAGTVYLKVEVRDSKGTQAAVAHATLTVGTADGLVAHYPFDLTIAGATASSPPLTAPSSGAIGYTTGRIGSAIALISPTYLKGAAALNVQTSLTVSGWVQVNQISTSGVNAILFERQERGLDACGPASAGNYGLAVSGGKWLFSVSTLNAAGQCTLNNLLADSGPVAGTFYHMAGTYDQAAGIAQLYVNGVALKTQSVGNRLRTTTGGVITIGNQPWAAVPQPLNGLLDDLRIYNRALSAVEVAQLVAAAP